MVTYVTPVASHCWYTVYTQTACAWDGHPGALRRSVEWNRTDIYHSKRALLDSVISLVSVCLSNDITSKISFQRASKWFITNPRPRDWHGFRVSRNLHTFVISNRFMFGMFFHSEGWQENGKISKGWFTWHSLDSLGWLNMQFSGMVTQRHCQLKQHSYNAFLSLICSKCHLDSSV